MHRRKSPYDYMRQLPCKLCHWQQKRLTLMRDNPRFSRLSSKNMLQINLTHVTGAKKRMHLVASGCQGKSFQKLSPYVADHCHETSSKGRLHMGWARHVAGYTWGRLNMW